MVNRKSSIIVIVIAVLIPLMVSDYWLYVLTIAMFYSIMASSWNLLGGYTGQFSLGHHTFALIGAYGSSLLMIRTGVSFWISIPSGILFAAIISVILGVLCLRVNGLYLALITWAFAEVVRNYIRLDFEFTGGDRGLQTPLLFGTMDPLPYYYLFLSLSVFSFIIIAIIMKSRLGYYLKSIREDEIAAKSMGVNVIRYKIFAFIIASGIAAMAGIFYGHSIGLISPKIGNFNEMAMIIIFVVIGGMRSLSGPIMGAFVVRILMEVLRDFSEIRIVILSAIVIVLMRFYNGGLVDLIHKAKKIYSRTRTEPSHEYEKPVTSE